MPSQVERFEGHTDKSGDCWEWKARHDRDGYGRFKWVSDDGTRGVLAHRFAYIMQHGTIPPGLVIDHLCRNRGCVNPAHLEAVTQRENTLRGDTVPSAHAKADACVNGHSFDAENTRHYKGRRICRACNRERQRRKFQRDQTQTGDRSWV